MLFWGAFFPNLNRNEWILRSLGPRSSLPTVLGKASKEMKPNKTQLLEAGSDKERGWLDFFQSSSESSIQVHLEPSLIPGAPRFPPSISIWNQPPSLGYPTLRGHLSRRAIEMGMTLVASKQEVKKEKQKASLHQWHTQGEPMAMTALLPPSSAL